MLVKAKTLARKAGSDDKSKAGHVYVLLVAVKDVKGPQNEGAKLTLRLLDAIETFSGHPDIDPPIFRCTTVTSACYTDVLMST